MKNTIKSLLSILIVATIIVSAFTFNVSAASATITGAGEYEIGSKITAKISFSADATLYAVEVDVTYNASVLRLDNVSGADFNPVNGGVKIVDDKFSSTKPSKTSSYTLSFTAIAAGQSNIAASFLGAGDAESRASTSAAVTVVAPKPSSNANLASIKLSNGTLSPAFNPNTTNYNVTVKYDVDSINITGSVADGKSTYIGGGSVALQVGENERVLTVTAEDGTKKSYTIKIKRMSEQETLDAEQAARDANPNLVIIDGQDYNIVNDLSGVVIPAGFVQGTAARKESEVTVLNDEHGEYTLYWLVDAAGENGAFYTCDENDNFTRVSYINANGKMYIIEKPDVEGYLPEQYVKSNRTIDGVDVAVYNYADKALNDFCVVKCYVAGTRAYYRFDTLEGTVQRAVEFDLAVEAANAPVDDEVPENTSWFAAMNKTGKVVFFVFIGVAVLFIAIAILLIVKILASKHDNEEYISSENDNFIITNTAEYAQEDDEAMLDINSLEQEQPQADEVQTDETDDSEE